MTAGGGCARSPRTVRSRSRIPQRWDIDHPAICTRGQRSDEGQTGGGPLRHAVRHPHRSRSIKAKGFLLNGRHGEAPGRLQSPRPGRAGRGGEPARDGAAVADHEVGGRERDPHQPQSAVAGTARTVRPDGADGDGRGVRMWRIPKVPNGYSKYFDQWSETRSARYGATATAITRASSCGASATRFRSRGAPMGGKMAKRLTGSVPSGGPARGRRPRRSTTGRGRDQEQAGRRSGVAGIQLQAESLRRDTEGSSELGDRTGRRRLPREFARRVPSADPEVREASVAASDELRHDRARHGPIAPMWNSLIRTSCRTCWASSCGRASTILASRRRTSAGERQATDWPARSSYFGMVDLAGFPKDRYYLYQSEWTKTPMVHVLPHWNWAGHEGPGDPGDGVHERRRSGAVPERQIAGPEKALFG